MREQQYHVPWKREAVQVDTSTGDLHIWSATQ